MNSNESQIPFSFDLLNACQADKLSALDNQHSRRKNIGIVGAGIAGLVAAYELEKLNHSVTIYEASDRIGGRIRTHRFSDGTYAELGAMRIPAHHHSTRHYIKELKLKLRPFVNFNSNAFYYIGSKRARLSEWEKIAPLFKLRANELNKDPRIILQDAMIESFAKIPTTEKYDIFTNLKDGIATQFDSQTMRQALLEAKTISKEAFDFIGLTTSLQQYEHASFLEVLIDYFGLFRIDQHEIVGGMDTLPLGIARRLRKNTVNLSSRVVRVRMDHEEGVTLYVEDGRGETITKNFDFVICTTPAPATARIEFNPPLASSTLSALRGVHYASSAKTIIHVKKRIWELEDGIAGGGSFTDELLQQCWYPSDNATESGSSLMSAYTGDDRDESRYSLAARAWIPKIKEISNSPAAFTGSYTWERNARRMSSLTPASKEAQIVRILECLHPGIKDEIKEFVHFSWEQQESPGGGAFAYFAPGDHARYMNAMQESYPREGSKVFFAGEHLSVAHAWIQGAIDTSLKAVQQILQRIG
jgi:monoamine oxidase